MGACRAKFWSWGIMCAGASAIFALNHCLSQAAMNCWRSMDSSFALYPTAYDGGASCSCLGSAGGMKVCTTGSPGRRPAVSCAAVAPWSSPAGS